MGNSKQQGPTCSTLGSPAIDLGTNCLQRSSDPGTVALNLVSRAFKQGILTLVPTKDSPEETLADDPRIKAMLDVISYTEGADYNTIVHGKGSFKITDFSKHPNVLVQVTAKIKSTAAGRYQILYVTWLELNMKDFTPRSQDLAAVKLLKRRNMLEPLLDGNIEEAVRRGNKEWASFPGSPYGQPTHNIEDIKVFYVKRLSVYKK